jgi:ribosomal protein S18 acetylase RimI-like enzyme
MYDHIKVVLTEVWIVNQADVTRRECDFMGIQIMKLETEEQKQDWIDTFKRLQINRPDEYYDHCMEENRLDVRVTLLAYVNDILAGVAHLKYDSDYPPFQEQGIPEINDLNIFPEFRRQGIANQMMDQFERIASERYTEIGIGVGLFKSYGAAQRIYCRRGYIPDGNGVVYDNIEVTKGEIVRVDDELNLYFTKELR